MTREQLDKMQELYESRFCLARDSMRMGEDVLSLINEVMELQKYIASMSEVLAFQTGCDTCIHFDHLQANEGDVDCNQCRFWVTEYNMTLPSLWEWNGKSITEEML